MNSHIPQLHLSHYECPWSFRRQLTFSRELIQKLVDGCEGFLGEWRYHDETNGQGRAVYRHHFRDPATTQVAAQSLWCIIFNSRYD